MSNCITCAVSFNIIQHQAIHAYENKIGKSVTTEKPDGWTEDINTENCLPLKHVLKCPWPITLLKFLLGMTVILLVFKFCLLA